MTECRRRTTGCFSGGGDGPLNATIKEKNARRWDLSTLLKYAKIFHIGNLGLSDDMTMRESKEFIEKRILEEIHPYRIYENKNVPGQWATHLPDPSRKDGRRLIRRNSYNRLCQAVIEYYLEKLHLDMSMDTLFDDWAIFRRDETSAKPGTVRKDVSLWRTHMREVKVDGKTLSNWKVTDITPKMLFAFFRKITKDRTYTKSMVNNIRGVFSGMFSFALERDLIQSNPVRDIDLKRLTYKPIMDKSDDVYTREEAQKLLAHLMWNDDPYALAIRLDFNLFIRVGEIAGLRWEDVDLENRRINIRHQITYEPELNDDMSFTDKKPVLEDYLKGCTSQGYRSQYITDDAIEILKKAREINPDGDLVFMPKGKPIVTLTFNKHLKKYCGEIGIPYRSSHKIRFYAASVAYDGNNLTAISRMMGHSQLSTTMHYLRDVTQDGDYSAVFKNLGRQE